MNNTVVNAITGDALYFNSDSLKGYDGIVYDHDYYEIQKIVKDIETDNETTIVIGAIAPIGLKLD